MILLELLLTNMIVNSARQDEYPSKITLLRFVERAVVLARRAVRGSRHPGDLAKT